MFFVVLFLVSGYYIYIETSSPRRPNDTARIMSVKIPSSSQKCLQFWYHMYGLDVADLRVYIKKGSSLGSPLWTRSGDQGNLWRHATVSVTSQTQFQVVFEGVRGQSYKGDIALDDISLQDGKCPPQALCTFEDPGLCGWANIHGDNFDWTRANGQTGSYGTGPLNDHSYGTKQGKA